jgi:hypothetical protein
VNVCDAGFVEGVLIVVEGLFVSGGLVVGVLVVEAAEHAARLNIKVAMAAMVISFFVIGNSLSLVSSLQRVHRFICRFHIYLKDHNADM